MESEDSETGGDHSEVVGVVACGASAALSDTVKLCAILFLSRCSMGRIVPFVL